MFTPKILHMTLVTQWPDTQLPETPGRWVVRNRSDETLRTLFCDLVCGTTNKSAIWGTISYNGCVFTNVVGRLSALLMRHSYRDIVTYGVVSTLAFCSFQKRCSLWRYVHARGKGPKVVGGSQLWPRHRLGHFLLVVGRHSILRTITRAGVVPPVAHKARVYVQGFLVELKPSVWRQIYTCPAKPLAGLWLRHLWLLHKVARVKAAYCFATYGWLAP